MCRDTSPNARNVGDSGHAIGEVWKGFGRIPDTAIVLCNEMKGLIEKLAGAERSVVAVDSIEGFADTVLQQYQNEREYRT
jgi:hypothetical protein